MSLGEGDSRRAFHGRAVAFTERIHLRARGRLPSSTTLRSSTGAWVTNIRLTAVLRGSSVTTCSSTSRRARALNLSAPTLSSPRVRPGDSSFLSGEACSGTPISHNLEIGMRCARDAQLASWARLPAWWEKVGRSMLGPEFVKFVDSESRGLLLRAECRVVTPAFDQTVNSRR